MDDLLLVIIFIIFSIISYFNKRKEIEPDASSYEWPEHPDADESRIDFESLQNVKQFEPVRDNKFIVNEQESIPISSDKIGEETILKSSVLHHEDKSVESKLQSGLKGNVENDAYALNIRTQAGQTHAKKKVHFIFNKLNKKDLKRVILLKEVLDRPRAFDI